MNIDLNKMAKVLSGELPKNTSVGWRAKPDRQGFTRFFVAFRKDSNEVVRAGDGSVKLNERDYASKSHDAEVTAGDDTAPF